MKRGQQQISKMVKIMDIKPLISIITKKFTITTVREESKHSLLMLNIIVALLMVQIDIPIQSHMYLNTTALTAFYWSECKSTF